jgi:nucleoside-diphosphate-sugar epimerase
MTDLEALQAAVGAARPDFVFHLATVARHPGTARERLASLHANVLGTANLLEAVGPFDLRRLVHFGSSTEYGYKGAPMQESDLLEPVAFHGVAKAAATLLCQRLGRAEGQPVVVLRPFTVYGPWEEPTRLIPTTIRAALEGYELALTAPGFRRDWVFVDDLVEACLLTLQADGLAGEIVNVGSGIQTSNEEIVEMVEALSGQHIRLRVGQYRPLSFDTTYWVADIRKARKMLNWEPRHTLRSGLEKCLKWYRARSPAHVVMGTKPGT